MDVRLRHPLQLDGPLPDGLRRSSGTLLGFFIHSIVCALALFIEGYLPLDGLRRSRMCRSVVLYRIDPRIWSLVLRFYYIYGLFVYMVVGVCCDLLLCRFAVHSQS